MAPVMRGGAGVQSKPRPKTQAPRVKAQARASYSPAYRPAKLHAASRAGLNPRVAVTIAAGVFALGLGVALFSGNRSQTVAHVAGMTLARQFAVLGFKTKAVRVQGAQAGSERDVLDAAQIEKDGPILGLDLETLRQRVEAVGWVKQAKVIRLLPDTLLISVVPRNLMAVWQFQGVDRVVDGEGKVVAGADASSYPDLPLVVGDGAGPSANTILPLLRQRPQLMAQLEAIVRVDGRRWDLRLKDGGIIELPAEGADSALIQLDQLEQKARVIELGFERIDLRDPDLVSVRPKGSAAQTTGTVNPQP